MKCADGFCYCYENDQFHLKFCSSTLPPFEFKECGQLFHLEDNINVALDDNNLFDTSTEPFPQSYVHPFSFCSHSEKEVSGLGMAQTRHYYYSSTLEMDVSKNEDVMPNIPLIPNTPESQFNFTMEAKLWALRFGVITVFTDPNLVMRHLTNPEGVDQNATYHSNSIRELIYSITRLPNYCVSVHLISSVMTHSGPKVRSEMHRGCTYYFYDDLPSSSITLTSNQSNFADSSFLSTSSLSSSPISSPPLPMTLFENRIESQWRKDDLSISEPIMHNQPVSPLFFPPFRPTGRFPAPMAGHRPHMGLWTQPGEPQGLWNQPMVPMGTWNQSGNFLVPNSMNWGGNMHPPVINQVNPQFPIPQPAPTPLMQQTILPPRQAHIHNQTTTQNRSHRNPGASAIWAHDRREREELRKAERIATVAGGITVKIKSYRKEFVSEVHYLPFLPRISMEESKEGNLHGESLSGFHSLADNDVRTMFKSLTM